MTKKLEKRKKIFWIPAYSSKLWGNIFPFKSVVVVYRYANIIFRTLCWLCPWKEMITNIPETGSARCVTVPATVQLPAVQTALCAGPSIKRQAALPQSLRSTARVLSSARGLCNVPTVSYMTVNCSKHIQFHLSPADFFGFLWCFGSLPNPLHVSLLKSVNEQITR